MSQPDNNAEVEIVKVKNLPIDSALHALLKQKARAEGRVLKRMVEEKLRELVMPTQLELVSEPQN